VKKRNEFFGVVIAIMMGSGIISGPVFGSGYSDAELEYYTDMLAHLIVGEVEGSDRQMKEYVGSVVLNRAQSASFPESIEGVIFQEGQYSCTWDGNYNKTPSEGDFEIARDLLVNGSKLPEDVVFQAEFEQGSGTYISLTAPNGVTEYFCYG
jgi:hypothetical protein